MKIKKVSSVLVMSAILMVNSISAFAADKFPHAGPDRPYNGTGQTQAVYAGPYNTQKQLKPTNLIQPNTIPGTHPVVAFSEPSQITVAIYQRDSSGKEISGTWQGNVTVDFEQYVKDVLPNEWYESWGTDGFDSLEAGALAVKTYGWFHVISWKKDPTHNADVTNGTNSQMYNQGSGASAPKCSTAVDDMQSRVIGSYTINSDGTVTSYIVETGYTANHSLDGTALSQNGSYQDAKNGLNYAQIIEKWYSNLTAGGQTVDVCSEIVYVPN